MKVLLRITTLLLFLNAFATAQGTLVPVEVTGANDKRINIVFLSEGYTTASMPTFATHVNEAMNLLFSKEPWKQYRLYCNVYRIEIASNQNGTDNGINGGSKDTYFHTGFNNASIDQLCTFASNGQSMAMTLLNNHVPGWDVPIVLVNDLKYGGSGGPVSIATVESNSGLIVEHEIGHSLVDLADEYDFQTTGYTPAEKANLTAQTNPNSIKWKHWFEQGTPIPTPEYWWYGGIVGLYEGGGYRTTGWYRPHYISMMNGIGAECGQVNREAFVLKFYSLVSPIDSFTPTNNPSSSVSMTTLNFNITPKVPSDAPPLEVTWKIDNVVQADETGNSLVRLSDAIGNGSHTVMATLKDTTSFVRLDPSSRLQETKSWSVSLSNQMPNTLAAWRTAYGTDLGENLKDGMVNLIKYGLGIKATNRAVAADFPKGIRTNVDGADYLTLTIPRKWKRTDINYIVETGDITNGWNSGAGHTVVLQDTQTLLIVRDAVPISSASKRFIRLKISPK